MSILPERDGGPIELRYTCGPYCPRCHTVGNEHEWFDYYCITCGLMWYEAERRVVAGGIEVISSKF